MAVRRMSLRRRILHVLFVLAIVSLVVYLFQYGEKTSISLHSVNMPPKILDVQMNKFSRMCLNLNQIPIIKRLRSEKHRKIPNWLLSGHAVEIEEVNNPTTIQNIQMNKMTHACPEFFEAIIKDPKPIYQLCDTIELIITARDCNRNVLKSGGDFLWTWIKTDHFKASQTQEGNITDVGNGTYIARFTLRWVGDVKPVVAVVRTRQEVEYLRQLREQIPARFANSGYFKFNGSTEIVPCHTTPWMNLNFTKVKINKTRHLCNFTDPATGSPWFCIKPINMPCHAYDFTVGDTDREILHDKSKLLINSSKTFKYISITPDSITVQVVQGQFVSSCELNKTPMCNSLRGNSIYASSMTNGIKASGMYYKDVWKPLHCRKSIFDKERMIKTLRNKYLLLFGDSTIRQWSEYINATLGADVCTAKFSGTSLVYSSRYNISVAFTIHGFPVRGNHNTATSTEYIANRLDSLQIGGNDVIIVLSVWAHFTVNTLDFYKQRLLGIRNAVYRLQTRHPGTQVFIKSANTREKGLASFSNWYAWECDQLMRLMLGNIPGITIIDVWDMTIGHHTGFHLLPKKIVVKNEVDLLLSYL